MPVVGIVHYGVGNIGSLVVAFRKIGADVKIVTTNSDLKECDLVVLPGVGSFDSAIREIKTRLQDVVRLRGEKPVLGICLGMQIMFESSEEGRERGLAWFRGRVTKLKSSLIPHIGWNTVTKVRDCAILREIPNNTFFYFAHSYCVETSNTDQEIIAGLTEIGESKFVSILADEKHCVYGTQFHPERSSKYGLTLLRNFVELARE